MQTRTRMNSGRRGERGIALLTALILLLLMTGLAAGLTYMVMGQKNLTGGDIQANTTYYNTEAGIENMTVQLANLYQRQQSPNTATIQALGNTPPVIPGVTWKEYAFNVPTDANGNPISYNGVVPQDSSGLGGLAAAIIPISLQATAQLNDGSTGSTGTKLPTQVRMLRKVEVALIPVFQFGVFSDMDLAYHAGPDFHFDGLVHTNGNLFLSGQGTTIFNAAITVAKKTGAAAGSLADNQIFRDVLPNFMNASSQGYTGPVWIPTVSLGCSANGTTWPSSPNSTCKAISQSQGTVNTTTGSYSSTGTGITWTANLYGGGSTSAPAWDNMASSNWGSMLQRDTPPLTLPFINGATGSATDPLPIEIIRRPPVGEDVTSNLGSSRLYNEASIRIMLDDDPRNLDPNVAWNDADNVPLQATYNWNADSAFKYGYLHLVSGSTDKYYPLATGSTSQKIWQSSTGVYKQDTTWSIPSADAYGTRGGYTYNNYTSWTTIGSGMTGQITTGDKDGTSGHATEVDWPLLSGWIRVEIKKSDGTWVGVTREWLKFGFSRASSIPDSEHSSTHPVPTNSDGTAPILYLQELADRNGDGSAATTETNQTGASSPVPAPWGGNWVKYQPYAYYPINVYDTREGEVRDNTQSANSCAINGIMNVVEIDVGNLKKWLAGTYGTSGTLADNSVANGYILYFSDRRGNVDKAAHTDGGYDYLDTINDRSSAGTPNSTLDPSENVYTTPENTTGNFGNLTSTELLTPPKYIGAGFNYPTITSDSLTVFHRINCMWNSSGSNSSWASTFQGAGRSNVVLGPRHALRLVDTTLGNIPTKPSGTGGFTVASEQPVYLFGNYNATDAGWATTSTPSAVIADAVTLESTAWNDINGFSNPATSIGSNPKNANTTWYRLAVAAGKNHTFFYTSYGGDDWGSDGGVHNFLRFQEDWSGQWAHYKGSLVTLFYSAYGTGPFKCCSTVYSPPSRDYSFDQNFSNPALMPPGTPRFLQVVNTAYRQDDSPKATN